MTNKEEAAVIAEIVAKRERGEALTDREWRRMAYSPFGSGQSCTSCAAAVAGPTNVTERYRPRVIMN